MKKLKFETLDFAWKLNQIRTQYSIFCFFFTFEKIVYCSLCFRMRSKIHFHPLAISMTLFHSSTPKKTKKVQIIPQKLDLEGKNKKNTKIRQKKMSAEPTACVLWNGHNNEMFKKYANLPFLNLLNFFCFLDICTDKIV